MQAQASSETRLRALALHAALISVSRRPPPFGRDLLLRLRDGRLVIARISRLSPDTAQTRDQSAAFAYPGRRYYLHAPWERNDAALGIEDFAPFYSDAVTHWIHLEHICMKEEA